MKYVLLQAYGDNVISLSMLSRLGGKIDVIGTRLTQEVARLLELEDKFNIHVLFDDVPGFYNVRKAGVFKALKDLNIFRTYARRNRSEGLVFEKDDFRAAVLAFGLADYHASKVSSQVYINRKNLFEKVSNSTLALRPAVRPQAVRKVLINPLARAGKRNIGDADLDAMLQVLKAQGLSIELIDHTGEFARYRERVDAYYGDTTLDALKALIKGCDFFIGTDSFPIHLAYYFEKAFCIIFNFEYFDFLPPGSECLDNYVITDRMTEKQYGYAEKFRSLGVIR